MRPFVPLLVLPSRAEELKDCCSRLHRNAATPIVDSSSVAVLPPQKLSSQVDTSLALSTPAFLGRWPSPMGYNGTFKAVEVDPVNLGTGAAPISALVFTCIAS
jgi:hypothetical protein